MNTHQRRALAGVGAVAVAAVVGLAVMGSVSEDESQPEPPTTSTTTDAIAPRPETVVAYRSSDGVIVVLDSTTGDVIRDLPVNADGIVPTLAGPVDGTVFLDRSLHPSEIARITLEDAVVASVGNGNGPALSADGRLLAFVVGGGVVTEEAVVVVRDLISGTERQLTSTGPPGSIVAVRHLSWSADGGRLAFARYRGEVVDDVATPREQEVRVLDVAAHVSLDDAVVLQPTQPGVRWEHPQFRGRFGTLAVVETTDDAPFAPSRIVSVDPQTGEVLATLVESSRRITSLDADASGRHLLYTEEQAKVEGVSPAKRFLYRWSGDEPTLLGDGIATAVWE